MMLLRLELERWSGSMSVTDMLELYQGDPQAYFTNPKRKVEDEAYKQHALAGLKEVFPFHSAKVIETCFMEMGFLYTHAFEKLKNCNRGLIRNRVKLRKTKRSMKEIKYPVGYCLEFLKEKKYCELASAILEEQNRRKSSRAAVVETAREAGGLVECSCCYNTECLAEELAKCQGGHRYCRDCVARSCDVAVGEGRTVVMCLGQCW